MDPELLLKGLPYVAGIATAAAVFLILCEIFKKKPGEITFAENSFSQVNIDKRTPYERWRAELNEWVEKGGGQEGLQALLDRWDGVPHEKPKHILIAGVDVASEKKDVTVLQIWDNRNGIATAQVVEVNGSNRAADRFIERNRAKLQAMLNKPEYSGTVPFKVGQWVRVRKSDPIYADDLVKIDNFTTAMGQVMVQFRTNRFTSLELQDLEPAFPRKGEWWTQLECKTHAGLRGPQRADRWADPGGIGGPLVECGCLVPFNFGRGEEAKG